MWSSLNQMREAFEGLYWILAGDFNVMLVALDKKGEVEGFSEGMNDFDNFIKSNNLMDLDLKRFKFTWTNGRRVPRLCNLIWGSIPP